MNTISLPKGICLANHLPLTCFVGMNVLESFELAHQVALTCQQACAQHNMPFVFKASFDKANRSSLSSYRGPGMKQGLKWLFDIASRVDAPIITDVHEPWQVPHVAQVADVLQLPAFLSRQTDLVTALAHTNKPVNVKKAQFLAPDEMRHIVNKLHAAGNEQVMLCERGTMFGYHNLVVDMLGFHAMKALDVPVIFDVTHALQLPGAGSDAADGRRQQALQLAKAGVAQSIAGIFLEVHPDPNQAKCDGPSALPLDLLASFLAQVAEIDALVKSQPTLTIT